MAHHRYASDYTRADAREFTLKCLENVCEGHSAQYDVEGIVTELAAANNGMFDVYMLSAEDFWKIADRHEYDENGGTDATPHVPAGQPYELAEVWTPEVGHYQVVLQSVADRRQYREFVVYPTDDIETAADVTKYVQGFITTAWDVFLVIPVVTNLTVVS